MKFKNNKIGFTALSLLTAAFYANISAMETTQKTPFVPFIKKVENKKTTTYVQCASPHTTRIACHYNDNDSYDAWQEEDTGRDKFTRLFDAVPASERNANNKGIFECLKVLYEIQKTK